MSHIFILDDAGNTNVFCRILNSNSLIHACCFSSQFLGNDDIFAVLEKSLDQMSPCPKHCNRRDSTDLNGDALGRRMVAEVMAMIGYCRL